MRRILSLLLLATLLFTFVACGSNPSIGDETTDAATDAPTTEAPTTEAATTEAPTTEAPTTEAATTEAATTDAATTAAPTTEEPTTEEPKEDKFVYKHVVIIGIDGMGAYHLQNNASTPNLDRIFADYALTDVAQTYNPVASGPCWTSMFTGVDPRVMRTTVNPYDDDLYNQKRYTEAVAKYSTVFHKVKEVYPEADVACVSRWQLLQQLLFSGDAAEIDQSYTPQQWTTAEERQHFLAYVEQMDPNNINLAYFYFCEPDSTGHVSGWGSDAFHDKLTEVDAAMGDIFDALEAKGMLEDTLFIVTTDHGGKYNSHGHVYEPEALTITLGFRGKTVSNEKNFDMIFRDVAAVVLDAMGVEPLESWANLSAPPVVPEEIFVD